MPRNQSEYSQGERWHLLYEYFITHSGKDRPITTDEIISFYRSKGIEVHINTLYADIATIQTEIFGLEIEFDRQYNHGAGAYILQNPPFEPNELRLIIDSIQASKFITEAQAKKLSEKVLRYA